MFSCRQKALCNIIMFEGKLFTIFVLSVCLKGEIDLANFRFLCINNQQKFRFAEKRTREEVKQKFHLEN